MNNPICITDPFGHDPCDPCDPSDFISRSSEEIFDGTQSSEGIPGTMGDVAEVVSIMLIGTTPDYTTMDDGLLEHAFYHQDYVFKFRPIKKPTSWQKIFGRRVALRGKYSKTYTRKLVKAYRQCAKRGLDMTEHGLKRYIWRGGGTATFLNKLINTIQTGTTYWDPQEMTIIRYKDALAVVLDPMTHKVVSILIGEPAERWRLIGH
jgi:hypothetical protein